MKHVIHALSLGGDTRYFSSVKALRRAISGRWITQEDDRPGTMSHEVVLLTDAEGYDPTFSQEHFTAVLQELIDTIPKIYQITSGGERHVTEASLEAHRQGMKVWEPQALLRLKEVLPPALW